MHIGHLQVRKSLTRPPNEVAMLKYEEINSIPEIIPLWYGLAKWLWITSASLLKAAQNKTEHMSQQIKNAYL